MFLSIFTCYLKLVLWFNLLYLIAARDNVSCHANEYSMGFIERMLAVVLA